MVKIKNNIEVIKADTSTKVDQWTPLLQRVARHQDREAFALLFNHFAPLLKAFTLSNPGISSNAIAEELVQEVMLKVWNRATTFNADKASATTWIYTLTRNARIDVLRKQNRQSVEIESDEIWDIADDDENTPAAQTENEKTSVNIHQALLVLPAEQRQIIQKVYIEGKSHSEASKELKLPLGTVKSRTRLALSKLKLILQR